MSPAQPVPTPPSSDALWVELTVTRLVTEFDREVEAVRATVCGCRHDLRGTPTGALPELVERLARQRIIDSLIATRQREAWSPTRT
jgi:hypothetical protein